MAFEAIYDQGAWRVISGWMIEDAARGLAKKLNRECGCRAASHGMTDMRDCPQHLRDAYGAARECDWAIHDDNPNKSWTFCPNCGADIAYSTNKSSES